MKTIAKIAAACCLSVTAFSANAFIDGNTMQDLVKKSTNDISYDTMLVLYVSGIVETAIVTNSLPKNTCIPPNATSGQITDVVKGYLKANPNKRHQDGPVIVFAALQQDFPCQPTNANKPK